jgi:hypothetical protein
MRGVEFAHRLRSILSKRVSLEALFNSEESPVSNNRSAGPSWWYCAIGAVVILAGLGLFVWTISTGISHVTDNLTQIVVPGERELTLMAKLRYTIFLEKESVVDGRIYSTENVDGLSCFVTSGASGKSIETHQPMMNLTYSTEGRDGSSVLEFVTEESGVYSIACNYRAGIQGPQVVVAVGSGVSEHIFLIVMRSFAVFFGGLILGGSAVAIVAFLRWRASKQSAGRNLAPKSC